MNAEDEIDRRTLTYADVVRLLIKAQNVRAAFINSIDSELVLVVNEKFVPSSLNEVKEKLPIWLHGINFPKDDRIIYSSTCTRIGRIRTVEINGSPNRLRLMVPGLEKIF